MGLWRSFKYLNMLKFGFTVWTSSLLWFVTFYDFLTVICLQALAFCRGYTLMITLLWRYIFESKLPKRQMVQGTKIFVSILSVLKDECEPHCVYNIVPQWKGRGQGKHYSLYSEGRMLDHPIMCTFAPSLALTRQRWKWTNVMTFGPLTRRRKLGIQ